MDRGISLRPFTEYFMSQLPETGFLRLTQIIGNPKAIPPVPPLIPVKKSCWWQGVKSGRFPAPVKLGPRVTAWRVEEIVAFIEAYKNASVTVSQS
jgi:prophage regulatory protein